MKCNTRGTFGEKKQDSFETIYTGYLLFIVKIKREIKRERKEKETKSVTKKVDKKV